MVEVGGGRAAVARHGAAGAVGWEAVQVKGVHHVVGVGEGGGVHQALLPHHVNLSLQCLLLPTQVLLLAAKVALVGTQASDR